jgi:succinate dehydrogenase / fumarate reductase cytochrome b subunit
MEKTLALYDSTIGKKAVLAVTGIVLFGFVIVHMLGNLQVFLGPEKLNAYAATLKGTPPLLWSVRTVLLSSVVIHAWTSLSLVARTSGARRVGYRAKRELVTGYAALTMKYGGPALALFIVFHLVQFTYPGLALSSSYRHSPTDVYSNVIHAFQIPWVVAIYVVAQFFLGLHLYHGGWSLLQTLGVNHPKYNEYIRMVPRAIGVGVAAANISMPLAVLAGIVR